MSFKIRGEPNRVYKKSKKEKYSSIARKRSFRGESSKTMSFSEVLN